MRPFFVDPSVFLLAVGGQHELRGRCRDFVASAGSADSLLNVSVEGGQEFLFHRTRMVGPDQAVAEFDQVDRIVVWHDFNTSVLAEARLLLARGHLRGRDAVHAATAMLNGFDAIVSCDSDFDDIPGLSRLDPATAITPPRS